MERLADLLSELGKRMITKATSMKDLTICALWFTGLACLCLFAASTPIDLNAQMLMTGVGTPSGGGGGGGGTVAFDVKMTAGNAGTPSGSTAQVSAATTLSTTGLTLGSSATCLAVLVGMQGSTVLPTGLSGTWNGVSMTVLGTDVSSSILGGILFLTNPATGNHTLALSWTNSADVYVQAGSFTTTNTTTCMTSFVSTHTASSTTLGVSSSANDADVGSFIANGGRPTMNFTSLGVEDDLNPGGGSQYHLNGGPTDTFSFTGGGSSVVVIVGGRVVH